MRQTLAIFLDAYRELNSRKLFWISLSISLAVVVALAIPTQTDKGLSVFGARFSIDLPFFSSKAVSASGFYKFMFSWVGINLWLGWGATILALVSTASMVPEMVSSGAIEMTLSRPISRLRLFLTKYAAGLTFVGIQALVFALGAVLVIGVRGGVWDARPLLAVPIMVALFSFLYCVCVLVGLLTRSTLIALITVVLLWLFIWALGTVEGIMLTQRVESETRVRRVESQIQRVGEAITIVDGQIARLPAPRPEPASGATLRSSEPAATPAAGDPAAVNAPPTRPPPATPPSATTAAADGPDGAVTPPDPPRRGRGSRSGLRNLMRATEGVIQAVTDQDADSLRRRRETLAAQKRSLEAEIPTAREDAESMVRWHRRLYAAYTFLPKTGQTKDLFQRYVIDKSDWDGMLKVIDDLSDGARGDAQRAATERPLWWVLGTSFAFEFVVLGAACLIFCRRDF